MGVIIEGRADGHGMMEISQPAKHIQTNPIFLELCGKLRLELLPTRWENASWKVSDGKDEDATISR